MNYATLETLTVGEYQHLYRIQHSEADTVDKTIQSISVLTGLSENRVDEMLLPNFNQVGAELTRIFTKEIKPKPRSFIRIGGKRYGINYSPETFTAGQYVEIQTWMNGNVIENLHLIFASIVYEVKGFWIFKRRLKYNPANHPKISEAILNCKYIDIYSAAVFFSNLWSVSIKSLEAYLVKAWLKKGMKKQEMQELLKKVSDGYLAPKGLQTLKT